MDQAARRAKDVPGPLDTVWDPKSDKTGTATYLQTHASVSPALLCRCVCVGGVGKGGCFVECFGIVHHMRFSHLNCRVSFFSGAGGGRFSTAVVPSNVDVLCRESRKIPGPGTYKTKAGHRRRFTSFCKAVAEVCV